MRRNMSLICRTPEAVFNRLIGGSPPNARFGALSHRTAFSRLPRVSSASALILAMRALSLGIIGRLRSSFGLVVIPRLVELDAIGLDNVDHSVFLTDATGPCPIEEELQGLRLSNALKRITQNCVNEV